MFDRREVDCGCEQRSGSWCLNQLIPPEFHDGQRDRFVQRFGLDMGRVEKSVIISERYGASGGGHGEDYSATFVFCSLIKEVLVTDDFHPQRRGNCNQTRTIKRSHWLEKREIR